MNCRLLSQGALQRLEPYAGKLARTVLRGRGGSNVVLLPGGRADCYAAAHLAYPGIQRHRRLVHSGNRRALLRAAAPLTRCLPCAAACSTPPTADADTRELRARMRTCAPGCGIAAERDVIRWHGSVAGGAGAAVSVRQAQRPLPETRRSVNDGAVFRRRPSDDCRRYLTHRA